ncbi:DUF6304 family protein [uncultured Tenacibaculum sp.]|uniref:DUF6304 family protein n=1 Tax=uncultured Tenacibaculum sp. TaxID=174713 RepID=UPI00261470F8|nr:DUF6304 family protein [uncultured Tenacibaculum sp.]
MRKYSVIYKDKFGEEETEITSDGSTMFLTLRNIDFEGSDFESLEGKIDTNKFQYEMYQNGLGDLTNFIMEVTIPIKISHEEKIQTEKIRFIVEVGEDLDFNSLNPILYTVELNTSYGKFTSKRKIDWFENSIIEIQNLLPNRTQIKTCLSCKYANYHPVGNGMFGSLYCFKKMKKKLKAIKDKHDLMDLWTEEAVKNNDIFNVQEVFDCSEHEFITPQDWTYKDWDYKTNQV